MNKSFMFPGVGIYANVDHVCLETTFLKFQAAILFLRKFGYELGMEQVEETSGVSVLMVKEGCVSIQVRESPKLLRFLPNENHIGFLVDDPEKVWQAIKKWAAENGLSTALEMDIRGVLCVSIPEVFNQAIELVANPNACPECHASGVVILGCEGQSYETTCLLCDGKKYIKN